VRCCRGRLSCWVLARRLAPAQLIIQLSVLSYLYYVVLSSIAWWDAG
jgi:hypothetical protein